MNSRTGLKKKRSSPRPAVDMNAMKMSGRIWHDSSKDQNMIAEGGTARIEDSFIAAISECISEVLKIGWKDRPVFQSCLQTATDRDIRVLLEQYLHHELEIIGKNFQRQFEIEGKINFDHATHAKMNDIIDAIKEKMKELV